MTRSLLLLALLSGCATLKGGGRSDEESDNASRVRAFTDEVYNQKKLDRIPFYVSEEFVDRSPGAPGDARGVAFVVKQAESNFAAFPDLRFDLQHVVAEADLVSIHWKALGTDARSVQLGRPKQVTLEGHSLFRLSGGKIVESWDVVDRLGAFRQMGFSLVPPPKTASP